MAISLKVNGKAHTLDLDPATPLLYVLRNDLNYTGPHFGCGLGQCGACTVILNGRPVDSCLVLAVEAEGATIRTIEGAATSAGLDPIPSAGLDRLILDLRDALGATFVVVTHELASILAIAALLGGRFYGWVLLDPLMGIVGACVIAIDVEAGRILVAPGFSTPD
mgnify:CR=1 FL=1